MYKVSTLTKSILKKSTPISVRFTPRRLAYLRASALSNERSINAELGALVDDWTKACPVKFVLRQIKTPLHGDIYTGALGEGDAFYDGPRGGTEADAFEAISIKIKELGLPFCDVDIQRRIEDFRGPASSWRAPFDPKAYNLRPQKSPSHDETQKS
jgi:hypothetical protein